MPIKSRSSNQALRHWTRVTRLVSRLVGVLYLGLMLCAPSRSLASGSTAYVSQNGGTFSGGSVCNGKSTTSIATSNGMTYAPGSTIYLCGVITTTPDFSRSSGVSGNPTTIIFDTGARVSQPFCNTICFNLGGASYITVDGGLPCGAGTACSAAETASPTGYPSGITGIIEATASGSTLANKPTGGQFFDTSGSNLEIKNLILRNIYVHSVFTDTNGGGSAYAAWAANNCTNCSMHDSELHDVGCAMCATDGPAYSGFQFYKNDVYDFNWGVVSGTYPGVVGTGWFIHDNHFGSTANWDDSVDNAHHDYIFLTRGGVAQGPPQEFDQVYIYNNLFDGSTGCCTTAPIYNSGGPLVNTYIFNNVFNFLASPKGADNALLTLSPGVGATTFVYNNTVIDSSTKQSGEGCFSDEATFSFANNVEKQCNGFQYIQSSGGTVAFGPMDHNVYGETGSSSTAGYWQSPWGNTDSFATWQSTIMANGCGVSASGCDTHSIYSPAQGSLMLDANGAPLAGSPAIDAGTNLTSLCGMDANLAALCFDTSAGNTRTPTPRPTTGAWTAGAYNYCTGGCVAPDGGAGDAGSGRVVDAESPGGNGGEDGSIGPGGPSFMADSGPGSPAAAAPTSTPGPSGCGCRTARGRGAEGAGYAIVCAIGVILIRGRGRGRRRRAGHHR
jgi:hypothetical protein